MMCPKCGEDGVAVITTTSDISVERYRKCKHCGYSFLTIETVKHDPALGDYKALQLDGLENERNKHKGQ